MKPQTVVMERPGRGPRLAEPQPHGRSRQPRTFPDGAGTLQEGNCKMALLR